MGETLEEVGVITAVLGNNNYRVEIGLGAGVTQSLCYLSGKMLRNKIGVVPGDKVRVTIQPPYDRGRITFREK